MVQGMTTIVTGSTKGMRFGIADAIARFFRVLHMQAASTRQLLGTLLVASMASVLFAPSVRAADPGKLIETMTARIAEIAKTKNEADRQAALREVVQDYFDLPYMGRSALGTRWNQASEQQQTRFLAAVEASEARAYSERLGKYASYIVTIGKVMSRPDGAWTVDSRLEQAGGQPTRIEWEVHESGQGLRIADVKVEGISLSIIMRSDFSSYIQSKFGQVESLVRELEARAAR